VKSVFLGFVVVLVLTVVCGSAHAYGVYAPSVGELVDQCAIVIVGRITHLGPGVAGERTRFSSHGEEFSHPVPIWVKLATVQALLVVKGDRVKPGTKLVVEFVEYRFTGRGGGVGLPSYAVGERRLFFLGETAGRLAPAEPLWDPSLVVPDNVTLPARLDGSPIEKTERSLARLIDGSHSDPRALHRILLVLRTGTVHIAEPVRTSKFVTSELLQAVVRLLDLHDAQVRRDAASVLCDVGYAPALAKLADIVRSDARAGGNISGEASPIGRFSNRDGLPELHRLLFDPEVPTLRSAAARALREIGAPSSAPFLVRALADDASDVRYLAATGLAGITGDHEHFLSMDAFKANEAAEIEFWSSWWNANASRFGDK